MDSKDRFALYYGMKDTVLYLFEKSKDENYYFNNLWRKVCSKRNILYALKRLSENPGRNTPGPDGMKFKDIKFMDHDKLNSLVKKRLHGKIKPEGRTVKIPKKDGSMRSIGITNILDRLAQQCIQNILEPITEARFYRESFGYRRGLGAKECLSFIWNTIHVTHDGYIFDADLRKYFDNVRIDDCIDSLRENFNIKDKIFLSRIKGLMMIPVDGKEYSLGLVQGTILGPVLANVLLHDLEKRINDINDINYHIKKKHREVNAIFNISRKRLRESGEIGLFNYEKNRRCIKIIRYADDFILYSNNSYDIYDGIMIVEDWLKSKSLSLNKEKSKLISLKGEFQLDFLGYKMRRTKENKWIFSVKDPKSTWNKCKKSLMKARFTSNDPNKYLLKMQAVMLGYLEYYSMCTRMDWFVDHLVQFFYRKVKYTRAKKIEGKGEFTWEDIKIQPWILRQKTSDSIKDYVKSKNWIPFSDQKNENLISYINRMIDQEENQDLDSYKIFLPGLIRVYKKEPLTGIPYSEIDPNNLHVHHVVPKRLGGYTEFSNLIVIMNESHKAIHNLGYIPKYPNKNWHLDEQKLRKFRRKIDDAKISFMKS